MKINEIHFFDLDDTLWHMSSMIWIIDKEEPGKPLMKLTQKEFKIIKNGVYKKDDILISYNDKNYYISKRLLTKLQKKKKTINADRLGFSFIEMLENKFVDKIKFLISNIYHLRNKNNVHIGLLSSRWDRHKDGVFLNQLRIELKDLGIDIDKIFFISDYFKNSIDDKIAYNKARVILEHLVGFKIEKNKFVAIKQDRYDTVYFYDDETKNIEVSNEIQDYFNELVLNTDDEVYNLIKTRLKETKLKLITNWISNNELNRFISTETILVEPVKYPIKIEKLICKFDEFLNESKKKIQSKLDELYNFIKELLPKETNITLERVSDVYIILKCIYDEEPLLAIYIDDINDYHLTNWFDEKFVYYEIPKVKRYIKDYFDFFYVAYNNYIGGLDLDIVLIPVFNTDKYSEYIYEIITTLKDKDNINNLKHIEKYLNKETLDKLRPLIDANNFDLI